MPDPTDLDAVVEYAADAFDPQGHNRALRAVIRRFLDIAVVDEVSRKEVVDAQIGVGQALTIVPRAQRRFPPR